MRDVSNLTDRGLAEMYVDFPREQEGEVLNEIAARVGIDLNETEQGFSKEAFAQVNEFVNRHYQGAPELIVATTDWGDAAIDADEFFEAIGHEQDDPKSEGYHERMADIWDSRDR